MLVYQLLAMYYFGNSDGKEIFLAGIFIVDLLGSFRKMAL